MTYIPPNPNGQTTAANSAPVSIASDQSAVSVSEQHLLLLTRIAKLLEAMSIVDSSQRQKVNIDAGTLPTVTTVATVNTVTAVTGITNALPAGANTIGAISNILLNAGMDREQYINIARLAYADGIRAKLN